MHAVIDIPASLSSAEVEALTGVTCRRLDYWIRAGVLVPSVRVSRGSGTPHRWSAADARVVGVLGELAAMGVETPTLRLVPGLLEGIEDRRGVGWLLVRPGRVTLCGLAEVVRALTTDEPAWRVVRLSAGPHGLAAHDTAGR